MDARRQWQQVRAMDAPVDLQMGPNFADRYLGDPKRISFLFARYAAAAKFLRDCTSIIEIGAGDGIGTATFLQDTAASCIVGVDFDETLIAHANEHLMPALRKARTDADHLSFVAGDFSKMQTERFSGAVMLDVIEHIPPWESQAFVQKIADVLEDDGLAVIGTPSSLAMQYASAHSMAGHINWLSPDALREQMKRSFRHCWILSMNDSVVHLGFEKMAHYLIGVGVK